MSKWYSLHPSWRDAITFANARAGSTKVRHVVHMDTYYRTWCVHEK